MKLLSSLLILWLAVGLHAEEHIQRIYQFGTLNTVSGDFSMQPNECRIAHNIDWGRNVGSISKRYGYDSVSTLSGQDSIVGIYGAFYNDGTQQIIAVTDSAGVGYGNVYTAPKGKASLGGTNQYNFSINGHNTFTYADTFIYVVDGVTDTSVVSYTSVDFDEPIEQALADSVNADSQLSNYFEASYPYNVRELVEGMTVTINTDTATTFDTTAYNIQEIWSPFAILNKPSFAMYDDVVYITNGSSKGIAYNGTVARSWPLNAPGEPSIIPLKTTGPMDGEYRYAFTYRRGRGAADSLYGTAGTVTSPIRVNSGQVLLQDFQWVGADTITASPDSIILYIYRTRANPGPLDERDSAFLIDSVIGTSAANLATLSVIDSVADEDLGTGIPIYVDDYVGIDSTKNYDHRYGAPTFLEIDSVLGYADSTDTTSGYGIYHGIPEQVDTLGVSYICTFMDTVFGIESAPSPPLAVMQADTMVKAFSQTIGLPAPVSTDSGVVRNIYRAHILQVTYDTSGFAIDYASTPGPYFSRIKFQSKFLAIDTVITSAYYLLDQVSLDSTTYTDSIRWDSAQAIGRLFQQTTPPPFMTQIFPHDGRMFGIAGSRLYMSRLDSAGAWGQLDFISLGEGDGDQLTTAFVSRGVIRALKNHSSFNVYQDADLDWNRREVSGYWGCIAPYSHAAGPLGHYYLSDRGVLRESEGQFLERTQAVELVSAPLKNLTDLPITTLDDAVGFYFDQKYMLCIGDTTYVYDERAKSWSTWSMTFSGASLYGTEGDLNFLPGDSMYFIKAGDSSLYRYGTSELDNGSRFSVVWKSAPILIDPPGRKTITDIEIAAQSDKATDSALIGLYSEHDSLLDSLSWGVNNEYVVFDSLTNRYTMKTLRPNEARYYSLLLVSQGFVTGSNAVIDMIDIYWNYLGRAQRK